MDSARWQALENGFATAHALTGDERERWLAECEANDAALAQEIRSLLSAAIDEGAIDRIAPQLASVQGIIDADDIAVATTAELPLPSRVGPYIVDREIGRGGMGIVCRAHDPRLGRDVALKIFPAAASGSGASDAEQRVLAEARAASALDHTNICTIYDVGSLDDGRPYLAMAYYSGGTLAERLTSGPLSVAEATTIATQVADALACAHAAGIVHRDVKPRNVAFGDRGEAKLLDFGVALLRDQPGTPRSAGTPAYMAPEQIRGDAVDARADVWALGVVLFEMLTGQRPFGGSTRAEVMHAIVNSEPPDVRALRSDLPAALARVVTRALHKSPAERIASAGDLVAAIRGAGVDGGRDRAVARGHRRIAIAVAVLAAVVAIGFVALPRRTSEPPPGETAALGIADPAVADMFKLARERERLYDPEGNEEAIQLLRNVLARVPDYAPAHAVIARAYMHSIFDGMSRQGDTTSVDSAMTHAQRAIALAPSLADGYSALGYIHASQIRHADAVREYVRALELDPGDAQTMMDLARSYMALDRFDEGVMWQERALVTDPLLPDARALVIARYNVWELFDHAWRHVNEGLRLVPTDVHLQSQAMLLELLVDDTVAARRRLDAMQPLLTPTVRARMGMFFALDVGDHVSARRYVDRIAATGASTQDFLTYGMVYRQTGERQRGDSLVRLRIDALRREDRRTRGASTQVAAALAHAYSVLGHADSSFVEFARWDSLGGITSRRRMAREPGWAVLRGHPQWDAVMTRMHAKFENGQKVMRARLDRDIPPDSATRARVVPSR